MVFLGHKANRPLDKMVMPKLIDAMGYSNITIHGFRSSFRTWATERSNFPREICEAALAHIIGDKSEQAYQRSDALEKRRKLMEAWGTFAAAPQRAKPGNNVTPLRRGGA